MSTNPQFLETADRIGRRLCRDAVWAGARCNWLGWSMEPVGGAWTTVYRAFASELYSGSSGVAIFLARLYGFTEDRVVRRTLEGALSQALSGLEQLDDTAKLGFYSGASGIAYTMIESGEILGNDALVERGIAELAKLRDIQPNEKTVDIISGSAGLIPVLLDVAARYDRSDLIEIAVRHGEHLLGLASKEGNLWSWDTMMIPQQKHLTGHSHGTAGIACAMLELHRAVGDDRFEKAGHGALRYERRHFSAQHGNWPDFRQMNPQIPQPEPSYTLAWCHGAPGIGLSRLRIYDLLKNDPEVLREIDAAIRTTSASLSFPVIPGQGNYSLCHGTAGNAELLIMAADRLSRPDLRQIAETAGLAGSEQFERNDMPWPCGIQNAGESPNLMLGLAGIGYFYLRLHDSKAVPSILLITPRPAREGATTSSVAGNLEELAAG